MRRNSAIIILFVIIAILGYFIIGIVKKAGASASIERNISSLPSFSFLTLSGQEFTSKSIDNGPLLIIYFNPECEHCHYEISSLSTSGIFTTGVKVLLVTTADSSAVASFPESVNLPYSDNIIILIDKDYQFSEIFGTDLIPTNFIYDHDLRLVKVLKGEYKVETILKYFKTGE